MALVGELGESTDDPGTEYVSSLIVCSRAGLESIVKAGTERVKHFNSCFTLLHLAPSRERTAQRKPERSNNHRTSQLLLPVSLRLDSGDG